MATLGVTEETFTLAEILDVIEAHGLCDEYGSKRISKDAMHKALTKRIQFRTEEAAWNLAHGLTATCPECGNAMKDDERDFCSWKCWYAATLKTDRVKPDTGQKCSSCGQYEVHVVEHVPGAADLHWLDNIRRHSVCSNCDNGVCEFC